MDKHPLPCHDREQLCRWLVDAHNNANKANRRKLPVAIPDFTYKQAVDMYAYDYEVLDNEEPACKPKTADVLFVAGSIAIAVLFILVFCGVLLYFTCFGSRCSV